MGSAPVIAGSVVISSVPASASVQTLLVANDARHGVVIVNTDTNDLYIRYGAGAALTAGNWTYKLSGGMTFEMPWPLSYGGVMTGIWSAAAGGYAEITEF